MFVTIRERQQHRNLQSRGRKMSTCNEMQTVCAGYTGDGRGGKSAMSSGLKLSFASPFTQESQDSRIDVQISVRSEVDM